MENFKKISGTIFDYFKIGLSGPLFKKNSTDVLEIKNENDTEYAKVRVATPVNNNDAATKQYVDSIGGGGLPLTIYSDGIIVNAGLSNVVIDAIDKTIYKSIKWLVEVNDITSSKRKLSNLFATLLGNETEVRHTEEEQGDIISTFLDTSVSGNDIQLKLTNNESNNVSIRLVKIIF